VIGNQLGNYKIIRLLGCGGMGQAYLAEDGRLGRKLALKLLPPDFNSDRERLARFELEARAASALNHPSILTIYEIGELDGLRFIATEFVKGQTLRERIGAGRMSIDEALDVAEQTASGLACAHDAGIVHRDIKPENLMLRDDGIVKILDFGLAKRNEQSFPNGDTSAGTFEKLTGDGTVMGTAGYMSPEQARGLPVDARTDIFSLGVVLYEMVAGRPPFSGNTPLEVISEVLKSDPEPLSLSASSTSVGLEAVVAKALRKHPIERYQSMREMSHDLRRQKQLADQVTAVLPLTIETDQPRTRTSTLKPLLDSFKRFKAYIAVALARAQYMRHNTRGRKRFKRSRIWKRCPEQA
jgi:serine/threonine protein kinase